MFSVNFCILYAYCPPYFYFRFVWPTYLQSIPHASTPMSIIPTKFEVDMTIHCRVTAFLSADTSRDLVTLTLTFDLLTLNSCHTWRVTWPTLPPSLKTICLSVLWVGGQKQLLFWNSRPRFAYSLYKFYCAPTTIKCRLLSSRPMFPSKWGSKMAVWGKMGVQTLDIGFATPKRHFLAQNRVVWRILRQNWCARLGGNLSQEPKKVAESLCAEGREITHAQNRNWNYKWSEVSFSIPQRTLPWQPILWAKPGPVHTVEFSCRPRHLCVRREVQLLRKQIAWFDGSTRTTWLTN